MGRFYGSGLASHIVNPELYSQLVRITVQSPILTRDSHCGE